MSVAIRTITRVQDADDLGSTPGAGNDGYALTWDNGAGAFVLAAAGVTDHGALSGLSDDDHSGYALLAGRSGGQTLYGGTAAGNGLTLYSTSHATKGNIALGTTLTVDSVNARVGIGTTTPTSTLSLGGNVSTATTEITALSFKNSTNTVAKISVVSTDTTQDDGDLVFSTAFNGSLTEKLRIQRNGAVTFQQAAYFYDANSWINGGAGDGELQIGARTSTAFYTALNNRDYAYFHSDVGLSHISPNRTTTNDVGNVLILRSNITSGTPAAGYGGGLEFQLQSSTTASQSAALMTASWIVATHASRTARLALSAYDYNGAREGIRIDTTGSAALLGFYGHAAVGQQVLATGAGASVDNVISALQALGLVKQS